jgi:predicted transport protein
MSTDALKNAEANQLKNIENSTGKTLEDWAAIIKSSGFVKHGELVNFLKNEHGLGHGNANMLVHHTNKSHSGFDNEEDLIQQQYKGKEELKAIYEFVVNAIKGFGDDVELSPKKAYVSIRRKKQFAIIQPSTKTRLDIGLNFKNVEPTSKLESAGSWNTMCTHRIKLEKATDVDSQVINWLKTAYDQS